MTNPSQPRSPSRVGTQELMQLLIRSIDKLRTIPAEIKGGNGSVETELKAIVTAIDNNTAAIQACLGDIGQALLQRTRWLGEWVAGDYSKSDQVIDQGWLMVANKPTSERPAPQPIGTPAYIYTGTSPTDTITAKQLAAGMRYLVGQNGYITGYRIYQVQDYEYSVYVVRDPDGTNELTEILSFVGTATGWREFTLAPIIALSGEVFELWVGTTEPDATPTTITGDWNYQTPNNQGTPGIGNALHSNKTLGVIRFNNIDDNGGDRSAELLALTPGDIIEVNGQRWSIQADPIDGGTYVEFGIAPAVQATPDGVATFTFETVTATPITTVVDLGYWNGNTNVAGYYIIDGGVPVVSDDQYGVDVMIQNASISEDWDFQAYTE